MKRKILIFTFFVGDLFFSNLQLEAQWFPRPFPDSLYASIGVSRNYIFAGVAWPFDSSIFRSTDGGFTWQIESNGLPLKAGIQSFAVKDSFVFAAGDNWAPFFRSSNNGDTWIVASTGIANLGGVYALTVLDTFIFVATGTGVFVSTNDGTNWQETSLKRGGVFSFAVSGNNLFAGAEHPTSGGLPGSIYLSTDYGVNWKTVNNGLSDSTVLSLAVVGSDIFAATGDGSVYRSTDNGTSWQRIITAPTDSYGSYLAMADSILFVGNTRGIFLSTDKGTTWIDTKYPSGQQINSIVTFSGFVLADHSNPTEGLFRREVLFFSSVLWILSIASIQADAQWWPVPVPDSGEINTISANNNYLYLGLGGFSYGLTSIVYRSTDYGATWQSASHGLVANDNAHKFAYLGTSVLLGTDHGLYSTSDHGDNWINMGMTKQVLDVAVAPNGTGDTNIYLATNASFYYTTDRGSTWQLKQWRNGLLASIAASGSNIFIVRTFPPQVIGGQYKDSVFLSTDYGSTWGAVMNGLPDNTSGYMIVSADTNIFISLLPLVYSSPDEGKSWHQDTSCPTDQIGSFLFAYNKLTFTGNTLGIFASTDYGTTWIDSKYPAGSQVFTIGISGNLLFAGPTSNGALLVRPLNTFLSVEEQSNIRSTRFELEQNFPDPFNPTTTIQFALPHESHVTLKVYNLLGQEVQTLVNDMRTVGSYNVEVDASNLSSGLYIYRLSAGDFIQTKKMLLIR